MRFKDKTFFDKTNNTNITIKSPSVTEAEEMLEFITTYSNNTGFVSKYPNELNETTFEQEVLWIDRNSVYEDRMCVACYINNEIVANSVIKFNDTKKTNHLCNISMVVAKEYWDSNIGDLLLEELISSASIVELIETEIVEGNDYMVNLFHRHGFKIVANIPNLYKLDDDKYLGKVYMQKWLR